MKLAPRTLHFQTSKAEVEAICKSLGLPLDYYASLHTGNSGEAFGGGHWIIDDFYQSEQQQKAWDAYDNGVKKGLDSRTMRGMKAHCEMLQQRDEDILRAKKA